MRASTPLAPQMVIQQGLWTRVSHAHRNGAVPCPRQSPDAGDQACQEQHSAPTPVSHPTLTALTDLCTLLSEPRCGPSAWFLAATTSGLMVAAQDEIALLARSFCQCIRASFPLGPTLLDHEPHPESQPRHIPRYLSLGVAVGCPQASPESCGPHSEADALRPRKRVLHVAPGELWDLQTLPTPAFPIPGTSPRGFRRPTS